MNIAYIIDNGFAFIGVKDSAEATECTVQNIGELAHYDYIIVLEAPLLAHVDQVLEYEWLNLGESFIVFLIERKAAPVINGEDHGPVSSFVCSAKAFNILYQNYKASNVGAWAYHFMQMVYDGQVNPDQLLVRQLPFSEPIHLARGEGLQANTIIPHKGKPEDLNTCLKYQLKCAGIQQQIAVALDGYDVEVDQPTVSRYSQEVAFYTAEPHHVGPYVLRELLINQCSQGVITFVDSDDISCTDRLNRLLVALGGERKMVGSHELRFDTIDKKLRAIRYPLDVSEALKQSPGFPLLHSTAALSLQDFKRIGGYATDRRFANDTQFLLRSYFFVSIMNVDEFLYIRKTHKASLTSGGTEPLQSKTRTQLASLWNDHFDKIKRGQMPIEDSSLHPQKPHRNKVKLVAIPTNKEPQ